MYYNIIKDSYMLDQSKLFINTIEYVFYLPYYMIIVGDRLKIHNLYGNMYSIIFESTGLLPEEWWIHNLFNNIQFYINELPLSINFLNNMFKYIDALKRKKISLKDEHNKIITRIIEKFTDVIISPCAYLPIIKDTKNSRCAIFFSITTCKRLDLFKKTMYSILNNWTDINNVDYFFCVDDNSSEEDRETMSTLFPFFNFYLKTEKEKGHRESMNIIWNKLNEMKPIYWIHMEDDWMFFQKKDYIMQGVRFLNIYENEKISQIVFNKNYGLMYSDLKIVGGIEVFSGELVVHEKRNDHKGINCGYWPHYSLQPSITRVSTILDIGNYDSPNVFFERDYADKYTSKGYKTAFFPFIYSTHIGKQHTDTIGQNAYKLNGIKQFGV